MKPPCRLEHAIDDDMEVALSRLITKDTLDPSSRTIPDPTEDIAARLNGLPPTCALADMEVGTAGRLSVVLMPAGEMEAMAQSGFAQGAHITRTEGGFALENGWVAQLGGRHEVSFRPVHHRPFGVNTLEHTSSSRCMADEVPQAVEEDEDAPVAEEKSGFGFQLSRSIVHAIDRQMRQFGSRLVLFLPGLRPSVLLQLGVRTNPLPCVLEVILNPTSGLVSPPVMIWGSWWCWVTSSPWVFIDTGRSVSLMAFHDRVEASNDEHRSVQSLHGYDGLLYQLQNSMSPSHQVPGPGRPVCGDPYRRVLVRHWDQSGNLFLLVAASFLLLSVGQHLPHQKHAVQHGGTNGTSGCLRRRSPFNPEHGVQRPRQAPHGSDCFDPNTTNTLKCSKGPSSAALIEVLPTRNF